MSIRFGYACKLVGEPDAIIRTCLKKNLTNEVVANLIQHNISSLRNMIEYNIKHSISLLRISSDFIPFASSADYPFDWKTYVQKELEDLGSLIRDNHLRVSMHPGQYCVLNSPHENVVNASLLDLDYHTAVLDLMKLDFSHKIILHIGGVYQDKPASMNRFIHQYHLLSQTIKNRLVLENDERSYSILDVYNISQATHAPIVFDLLHHEINPSNDKTTSEWLKACASTWGPLDGNQKIHYSQQAAGKRKGAHSATIHLMLLDDLIQNIRNSDYFIQNSELDIMLEVKDKNLSAKKCVLAYCTTNPIEVVKQLEMEWSRYKYLVLEHSQANYLAIRKLLKNKSTCSPFDFYKLIDLSLASKVTPGCFENAALHIFGYFKNQLSTKEKASMLKLIAIAKTDSQKQLLAKRKLYQYATKYNETYLLQQLYFYLL